jgi:hypothetical protein
MNDPEFSFRSGRYQIEIRGRDAIRESGWAIRWLIVARALAITLPAISAYASGEGRLAELRLGGKS